MANNTKTAFCMRVWQRIVSKQVLYRFLSDVPSSTTEARHQRGAAKSSQLYFWKPQ